jgi:hypothetical protein
MWFTELDAASLSSLGFATSLVRWLQTARKLAPTVSWAEVKSACQLIASKTHQRNNQPTARRQQGRRASPPKTGDDTMTEQQKALRQETRYAVGMLESIIIKIEQDAYSMENVNWGHVGDIKHLSQQLKDLEDRVYQCGEYART